MYVGLAIWHRAGVKKSGRIVLTTKLLEELGVDRYAKKRALSGLEKAGLIEVCQQKGKNPIVTLLSPSGEK